MIRQISLLKHIGTIMARKYLQVDMMDEFIITLTTMRKIDMIIKKFQILGLHYCYQYTTRNDLIIVIDSQIHIDFGLSYPITYELSIPPNSFELKALVKFKSEQNWLPLSEKTSNDFFNGIEAVRYSYDENIAYVSIGFSEFSDSIFVKIIDSEENNINSSFIRISQYYDNRDAVVTSTADDWGAYSNFLTFVQTCENFQEF